VIDEPLSRNAADPEQVRQAGAQQDEAARHADAELRAQLGTPAGRAWYMARISKCGVFGNIGGTNEDVHRALGRREVGLELLIAARRHPDLYAAMWSEEIARSTATNDSRRAAQVPRAGRRRDD
jgi:hypothetical protein